MHAMRCDAGQGRGRGCTPAGCIASVAADVVLSFGQPTHSTLHAPHLRPAIHSLSARVFAAIVTAARLRGTMASNKKSGLTGYLPDILMAAAAVRSRLPTRRLPLHALFTASNTSNSHL